MVNKELGVIGSKAGVSKQDIKNIRKRYNRERILRIVVGIITIPLIAIFSFMGGFFGGYGVGVSGYPYFITGVAINNRFPKQTKKPVKLTLMGIITFIIAFVGGFILGNIMGSSIMYNVYNKK
ncbi:MAG: hypothetical protein AB1485_03415 [Candidatus Thermoplasmatota archaeon]